MSESGIYNAPYLDVAEHAALDHSGVPGAGGGGGDPFPSNPDFGNIQTYIADEVGVALVSNNLGNVVGVREDNALIQSAAGSVLASAGEAVITVTATGNQIDVDGDTVRLIADQISFFGAGTTPVTKPDGVSAGDALEALGLASNVLEGGGDPFPADPDLGGMRTYIIDNAETLAITTADFTANMTISGASSMGMQSTTNVLQFNGGTAQLSLDPANGGTVFLSGTLMGFFDGTPTAKPTGVAVTAEAIHAALVSLGLIEA